MAKTLQELAIEIMRECEKDGEPVSETEALEMAQMELRAKGISHYEKSDKPRKSSTRERKVDDVKRRILDECGGLLETLGATGLETKTETEITFTFDGAEYSLKLIRHRPPKS